jgi:tetratricopeptide (TPR) repeat protein
MKVNDNLIRSMAKEYKNKPKQFIKECQVTVKDLSPLEKGEFFQRIGIDLFDLSYYDLALESFHEAFTHFYEIDDKEGGAVCYSFAGLIYYIVGQYKHSIYFYELALELYKHLKNKKEEAVSYNNLGLNYYKLGQNTKAIELFQKSLEIARKIKDRKLESEYFYNMARVFDLHD